jgi:hypothetical protein
MEISHLLIDDTILFCETEVTQLGYFWCVLLCFEVVLDLGVNLSKSELVPVGEVRRITKLVSIVCCKLGQVTMMYLGLPLGFKFKDIAV